MTAGVCVQHACTSLQQTRTLQSQKEISLQKGYTAHGKYLLQLCLDQFDLTVLNLEMVHKSFLVELHG